MGENLEFSELLKRLAILVVTGQAACDFAHGVFFSTFKDEVVDDCGCIVIVEHCEVLYCAIAANKADALLFAYSAKLAHEVKHIFVTAADALLNFGVVVNIHKREAVAA